MNKNNKAMEENKKKKNVLIVALRLLAILYFFGVLMWNTAFTGVYGPEFVTRKVLVEKVEEGEYTTDLFDYFSPYDRRITVDEEYITYIFASSDLSGFDQIKENDSVWVELVCEEASTWGDFFLFGRNFNYELWSLPNQNDPGLEEDSLFTADFWIPVSVFGLIILMFLLSYLGLLQKPKEKIKKIGKKK